MFSFPQRIDINYTENRSFAASGTLNIGSAVKDLEDGALTSQKQAYNDRVASIREKFERDTTEYQTKFDLATTAADEAKNHIGEARKKRGIAVTALALTIIFGVGLLVAAAITLAPPLAFAAIPFIALAVPAIVATDHFRKIASRLNDTVRAPGRLVKPQLHLPAYYTDTDLELKQTRVSVQNRLAGMTLPELATSGYSKDKMVKYALLDHAKKMNPEERPEFYSRSIKLMQNYDAAAKEHLDHQSKIAAETARLNGELNAWARAQHANIEAQERVLRNSRANLQRQDIDRAHGMRVRPNFREKIDLDFAFDNLGRQRRQVEALIDRRSGEIRVWNQNMVMQDNGNYTQVIRTLSGVYNALKVGVLAY